MEKNSDPVLLSVTSNNGGQIFFPHSGTDTGKKKTSNGFENPGCLLHQRPMLQRCIKNDMRVAHLNIHDQTQRLFVLRH